MKTRWWIWQQWCFINWWVEANMFVDVVWVMWIMLHRVWLRENLKKLDLWKEDCQDQCRCWHMTNICLSFFCQVYRRWLPPCCKFVVKITKKIVHIGAQSHPYEAPVWDNKMISGIAFGPFVNVTEIYGYSTSWSRILVWYHSTHGNGCWMKTSWLVCRKRSHPPRLSHLLRNCLTALSELPTSSFVAS